MDQAKCDTLYMSYYSTPPPAYNWLLFAPHEPCPASYLSRALKYPMPSTMLTPPESINSSASIDDLDALMSKEQQQQPFRDIFSPTLRSGIDGTPVSYTYVDSLDTQRRSSFSGAVYTHHAPFNNESGITRQVELPSKVLQDEYCTWFAQEYPPMLPLTFSPRSLPAAAPAESHSFGMLTPSSTLSHGPLTPDIIKEEQYSPLFPRENGMTADWPSPNISATDIKGSEASTMDALLELMTMTPPTPCLPLTSISPQHIPTSQEAHEERHTHVRSPTSTEPPFSPSPPTKPSPTPPTTTSTPLPPKIAPRHLPSLSSYMSRRFICPIDNKRFTTRASLSAHTRIHTPRPRNHTCRLCGGRTSVNKIWNVIWRHIWRARNRIGVGFMREAAAAAASTSAGASGSASGEGV
ncbi:hypothetical protein BC832DRAFT_592330 [Gaertneriomyces semiglobifer]|nr:hypothetical protein BC832DRAFT_592330 [Gaertneriomyces semiglobifer]